MPVSGKVSDYGYGGKSATESQRGHILIADDEPQVLKLFARLLEGAGYAVTAVPSGREALKALGAQRIDLLILDLNMPPPDGFELLKILRKNKPGLPVLVVSGVVGGMILSASEYCGAAASLAKKDAPGLLVETVNGLLS